jgi:uncharacterized protein (TIGR03382 family)
MRKLAFLALGIVAASGACSATPDGERKDPIPTNATAEQLTAFDQLEAATQKRWTWIQHDQLATPSHLSTTRDGDAVLKAGDDIRKKTIDVLTTNKALFKMRDPGAELLHSKSESDAYGMQHTRFQQVVHGVPVVGAEVSAHYDSLGHLTSIDANYIADLADIDVNPTLTPDAALAIAKAEALKATPMPGEKLEPDAGKLVVWAVPGDSASAKLAYELRVRALAPDHPAIWVFTIDAHTGAILHRYNNLQEIQASGTGVAGDTKTFEVSQSGNGGFVMQATDPVSGVQLSTFTAKGSENTPGTLVTSSSLDSWDTGSVGTGAAVDAHVNAGVVAKYYKATHSRDAIDGAGGTLESTVHFSQQYDNAAWISTGMIYGDGGTLFKALSLSVDVVGHEFTHGVTEKTSTLTYENQSGALNEAVSDIFGAFIEHSIKPDPTKNWQIGENVTLSGKPLRDMMNPNGVDDPQPAHMNQFVQTQQDSGGVHINSGIINNSAWLMTVGGTNPISGVKVNGGIGWDKAEKLWYQANTKYFQSTTDFAGAAAGVQQAGQDIGLTASDQSIVQCAFIATGVITGKTCASVASTQAGTGSATTSSSGSTSSGDDDDDDSTSTKKKKAKTHLVTTEEQGCNAGGGDLGSLVPMLMAIAALGVKRRRRSTK